MDEMDMDAPPRKSESPKDISFKESFRRAKDAGLKSFSFGGKKYTTEMAAAKATPKAVVMDKPEPSPSPATAPKTEESKSSFSDDDGDMRNRSGGNPYVAGLKKYGPGAALAAASLIPAGRLLGPVLKGIRGARAAAVASELAAGNASNASRMAGITANAEKEVASQAAKRDMFKASQERLKSGSGQATEDRLTGLSMNPRRANIPVNEGEFRKGGKVKTYAKGGSVSSASSRADGIATKGKTKGKYC